MATRFFVRSLFRIALARCIDLGGELRFLLFLLRLTILSLFQVEPIGDRFDWQIATAIAWLIQDTPGYSTDRDDEKDEKIVRTVRPNTNEAQFARIGLEKNRNWKQA